MPNQFKTRLYFNIEPCNRRLYVVTDFKLRQIWLKIVHLFSLLEPAVYFAFFLNLLNANLYKCDFNARAPLCVSECVFYKFYLCAVFIKFSFEFPSRFCVRIQNCFSVQNTYYIPSIFLNFKCFKKVLVSVAEWRIHYYEVIFFEWLICEEIIMDNVNPVFEKGIKLRIYRGEFL